MAQNYYHNAHPYPIELPLTFGGTVMVGTGKYVKGGSTGSFGRAAQRGALTDDGTSVPSAVTANPLILIFTEPVPAALVTLAQGAQGDTGAVSTVGGDTGVQGDTGAASTVAGDTGSKGDTGTHGDTGLGDTGITGDTGATGADGDTGVKGDTGTQGDTGAP